RGIGGRGHARRVGRERLPQLALPVPRRGQERLERREALRGVALARLARERLGRRQQLLAEPRDEHVHRLRGRFGRRRRRRQARAGNRTFHLAVGQLPAHRDGVLAGRLLVDRLEVVLLPRRQADGRGLLRGVHVPLPRPADLRDLRDQLLVGGISVGAEQELALVVAADPERVVARILRMDEAAQARAVVVAPVDRPLERRGYETASGLAG